ncbi:MAG: GGDEF domain-containing protein, partial [Actinobacteria bacterium]|nr:GGDEF domain-containing protein [Actinomycetota bacterium]
AAGCWGAGVVARQAWPGAAGGATDVPLTFADLPALLAPLAAAVGLAALTRTRRPPGRPAAGVAGWLADGYLLAAALFLLDWVIVLGPRYAATTAGAGTFALQLIRPLLDLLVLGAMLPLAVAAGRRALPPLLALLAVAGSDSLDVAARAGGRVAGAAALLLLTAAMCLLALAPAAAARWGELPVSARRMPRTLPAEPATTEPAPAEPATTEPATTEPAITEPATTEPGSAEVAETMSAAVAALTAVAAGVAVTGWGLAGALVSAPVIAVAGGTAAAALAARMLGLARRQRESALGRQESGRRFRELADRTSDVVLICDLAGVIGYASPAVAGYGYPPESLTGRHLGDFLHPEDRIGGARVVRAAVAGPEQQAGRYPCRVRAADGTWRHVQATVSRQANPPGPDQLLITARDLSDQVALRRQVAHLTFHDGLTGLPNRAYIEDRARDALGAISQRAATGPAAGSPGGGSGAAGTSQPGSGGGVPGEAGPGGAGHGGAGVILLDLDGFTALNDSAGRSAGDLILTQAARRLRAVVPAQHTVARWGGDEFAVLIEGGATARDITDIAERVAASISA